MTIAGWLQIGIFLVVLTAVTRVLGGYMAQVYEGAARLAVGCPRAG